MSDVSIQDTYITHSICFGCGPSNGGGLPLKSYRRDDGSVVAMFVPTRCTRPTRTSSAVGS